jgi:hypothetical protein
MRQFLSDLWHGRESARFLVLWIVLVGVVAAKIFGG